MFLPLYHDDDKKAFLSFLCEDNELDKLYRVYSGSVLSDKFSLRWEIFPILRETEHCWFIPDITGQRLERRVLKGNGKRYAHKTKQWALESFIRRNKNHRARLLNTIARAEQAGDEAEKMRGELQSHMARSPR